MVDWDKLVDRARKFFRAKAGLSLDDDVYQGLMHTSDDRERTKLTTRNVYRHNYHELLTLIGGEEWEIAHMIAEGERHLFISEDGQRATDFISYLAKKRAEEQPTATNVTIQTSQPQEPEKKKGWFRR